MRNDGWMIFTEKMPVLFLSIPIIPFVYPYYSFSLFLLFLLSIPIIPLYFLWLLFYIRSRSGGGITAVCV